MAHQVRRRCISALPLALVLLFVSQAESVAPGLVWNFYKKSCPRAELIVRNLVQSAIQTDPGIAGKLLRLHFHDCFVNGCEASVLLDSIDGVPAERDDDINLTLGGFDLVDSIKAALEKSCPGTVSCADLLALASRDAVAVSGGPTIPLRTGRRDGFNRGDTSSLPVFDKVNALTKKFRAQNLSMTDLVVLSGAHSIGIAHCLNLAGRLPPFVWDGLINKAFRSVIARKCIRNKSIQDNVAIPLDVTTANTFDSAYYTNLLQGRGLLVTDSILSSDPRTKGLVKKFSGNTTIFFNMFNTSMIKMSEIGVLTGGQGEVRLNCRVPNEN